MSWRTQAVEAIYRWNKLELSQKALASRASVDPSVITHVRDYPDFAISEMTARRIVEVVVAEEATRIESLDMEVVAYCHGQRHVPSPNESTNTIRDIKVALTQPTSLRPIRLPKDVSAVLVKVGGSGGMFLIFVGPADSDDEKRALAHELAHLRGLILATVEPDTEPPKSAY